MFEYKIYIKCDMSNSIIATLSANADVYLYVPINVYWEYFQLYLINLGMCTQNNVYITVKSTISKV